MNEVYDDVLREFAEECGLSYEFVFKHYHVVSYGSGELGVEPIHVTEPEQK